jgi:hypothetical protein
MAPIAAAAAGAASVYVSSTDIASLIACGMVILAKCLLRAARPNGFRAMVPGAPVRTFYLRNVLE